MSNEFKKAFVSGMGGTLGVLSIPVILFGAYWIYIPTIMFLQKQEYLEWVDCYYPAWNKALTQSVDEGLEDEALKQNISKYTKEVCGEKPNRWKWQ